MYIYIYIYLLHYFIALMLCYTVLYKSHTNPQPPDPGSAATLMAPSKSKESRPKP